MWTLVGCGFRRGKPMQSKIIWSWFYLSSNSQWLHNPSRAARNTLNWALKPDVWGAEGEGLWQQGGGCLWVSGESPRGASWRLMMLSSGPGWPRATSLMDVSDLDSCQPACSVGLCLLQVPWDLLITCLGLTASLPFRGCLLGRLDLVLGKLWPLLLTAPHCLSFSPPFLHFSACMVLLGGHSTAPSSFAA